MGVELFRRPGVIAASSGKGAMTGIADRIERFNLAYRLAWKYVPEGVTRERTSFARRLHDSISRQLREGASEPVFIASEALKEINGLPRAISK